MNIRGNSDNMKYAFLTCLIPEDQEETVRHLSRNNMQDAANALQWNLFEGFQENLGTDIRLFNVLPIGSFPQYYRKAFVKNGSFDTRYNQNNRNVGFCNVKLLRKYHQPVCIYRELKKWCAADNEEKTLFVYTVSAPFMTAVEKLRKKFPELKVCAIIADLPNMSCLSAKKGLLQKAFEKNQASKAYASIACVDAFVLLTKQMAEYMQIQKPWIVMEGIAGKPQILETKKADKKIILYTGTLHCQFGVLNLVEAFSKMPGEEYSLVICGIGDSEQEIRNYAEADQRIRFMGQVTRQVALQFQQQATVLVNPRQNNEEFTKYSFPSKTMEYLASGVPVVAYKLDGIPDEYDSYLNYVADDSAESLAEKLVEICNLDEATRREMGNRGAEFVLKNKNAKAQTLKIKKLIDSL